MSKSNSKGAPRAPAQDPRGAAKPAAATNPLAPPGASAEDHQRLATTTAAEPDARPRERKKLEDKVSVTVHKGFHLTDDNGMRHTYEPGVQDMPASHARHWYAAANGVEINE